MSIYRADLLKAVRAQLPDYVVGDEIGSGGFGVVFDGRHRAMGRRVAIKVLTQPAQHERFAAEARILARLDNHPHVARVFDYREGSPGRPPLFVMEHLSGGTLTARFKAREMPPEEICAIGIAVAEALHYAHHLGILHRDVKPDNVLFADDGTPKVTDFGIAKILENAEDPASAVIGSPAYMAPEQFTGGMLGPATDVFALGVVLYRLLSKKLPYQRRWATEPHAGTPETPPGPSELVTPVMRALRLDPAERQSTARQLALELADAGARVFSPDWFEESRLPLSVDRSVRVAARGPHRPGHPGSTSAEDPAVLRVEARRARGVADAGDHQAARELYSSLLPRLRAAFGGEGPDTLLATGFAAQNLREGGDAEAARDLFDGLLPALRRVFGENDERTLFFAGEAARALAGAGAHEDARDLYDDLLPRERAVLGEEHRTTLIDTGLAARNLLDLGENDAARALFDDLVPRLRRVLGQDNHNTLTLSGFAARALGRAGDRPAARALYDDLVPRVRRVLGENNRTTVTIIADAARALLDSGESLRARSLYTAVLPRVDTVLGPEDPLARDIHASYERTR